MAEVRLVAKWTDFDQFTLEIPFDFSNMNIYGIDTTQLMEDIAHGIYLSGRFTSVEVVTEEEVVRTEKHTILSFGGDE